MLALAQARAWAQTLIAARPDVTIEERHIVTTGDRIVDRPLYEVGGKGLFLKEIEEALVAREADFAVHSVKDVPAMLAPGLVLAAIPPREDPRDALVTRDGRKLADLPAGAKVGTSSLRRGVLLRSVRPDLEYVPLRGNVDTRIRKVDDGELDAAVLAYAGLRRLGRAERASELIDAAICLPAVGQGALGLECRVGDDAVIAALRATHHEETALAVACERGVMAAVDGSCQVPVAAWARRDGDRLKVRAMLANTDGTNVRFAERDEPWPTSDEGARAIGIDLGRSLVALVSYPPSVRAPLAHRSAVVVLAGLAVSGCAHTLPSCPGQHPVAGGSVSCQMPAFADRGFDLALPTGWDGATPLPLIVAIHGGGGNRRSASIVTCPNGKEDDPGCLSEIAKSRGFAVVRPDGVGSRLLRNVRTWNAGGGVGPWNCTSGPACRAGTDDVAYFRALLDEVARTIPIDPKRVFATGISNGGAMSHRLACEMPDRIAAIVAVGGTNQFAAAGGVCPTPIPVLQIHGTEDPCWSYATSNASCLPGDGGDKLGVSESMEAWRVLDGCEPVPLTEALPDRSVDGLTSFRSVYVGCKADVQLIRIEGGGHTWPGGHQYFSASKVGRVTRDFGSEVVVDFFLAHAKE